MVKQGDILYVDLNPTKGNEMAKTRPCVVVSNDFYNQTFNTSLVMPISSSEKYLEPKFVQSNAFQTLKTTKKNKIHGTILCQHIRSVDLNKRSNLQVVDQLTDDMTQFLSEIVKYFF